MHFFFKFKWHVQHIDMPGRRQPYGRQGSFAEIPRSSFHQKMKNKNYDQYYINMDFIRIVLKSVAGDRGFDTATAGTKWVRDYSELKFITLG